MKRSMVVLLVTYKCNSCNNIQKKPGNCDECGYQFLKKIKLTRSAYCRKFGHLGYRSGDKKLTSSFDCCTENFTYQCKRCDVVAKDSQTNSYGCWLHGPMN